MSKLSFHNSKSIKHILFLWLTLCLTSGIAHATGDKHCCETSATYPLVIDDTTQIGFVKVSYNKHRLTVKYSTNDGWLIKNTHLAVADTFEGLPKDQYGNPKLKRFRYKTQHRTPVARVSHMLSALDWAPGTALYIAAHAEVVPKQSSHYGKISHKAKTLMGDWSRESGSEEDDDNRHSKGGKKHSMWNGFRTHKIGKKSDDKFRSAKSCKKREGHHHDKEARRSESAWGKQYPFTGDKGGYYFVFTLEPCKPAPQSVVQFEQALYNGSENESNAVISVIRSGDLSSETTVHIKSMNGSAEDGLDYVGIDQQLVFNPGESLVEVVVPIIDDGDVEDTETVNFQLLNPENATLGTQDTAILEIADNDEVPPLLDNIVFEPAVYEARESAGQIQVTVKRVGSLVGEATVDYRATGNGSASPNVDYNVMPGTLVFADGVASATININIIEDRLMEPNETIELVLEFPSNANVGVPGSAVVTILDNDGSNSN